MSTMHYRLPSRCAALFALVFFFQQASLAQAPYDFKNSYDDLHGYYSGNAFSYSLPALEWYNSWGWTLLSYLRMFEATGDKAYLNKFVVHSYNLQMIRTTTSSGPLLWESILLDRRMHYSSELSRPMAEFVYLINTSASLGSVPFLPGLIPSAIEGQSVTTYGAYASWLENRVYLTLNYLTDSYWINNAYGVAKETVSACEHDCFDDGCVGPECWSCAECINPAELNMQADLAVACYYLAGSGGSGLAFLKDRADNIAEYFKANVEVYPGNQSKTWFDNPDCPGSPDEYELFRDDVSHGGSNIQTPLTSYYLHPGEAFSELDMHQFASTFSNNIWDANDQVYHGNVFGTDIEMAEDIGENIPNFYAPGEILSWMPLADFDLNDPPNNIYTLLTTQAAALLSEDGSAILPAGHNGNTSNLSGAQSFYGLSEVVKAQWSRDCADLVLGNRLLPYDQNFAAKHVLRVDADATTGASFADPVIIEPYFTVEADAHADFRAGAAVVFEPGFNAAYGSVVIASIDPLGCEMEVRSMTASGTLHTDAESPASKENLPQWTVTQAQQGARTPPSTPKPALHVSPNPAMETTSVVFDLEMASLVHLVVFDELGRTVQSNAPVQMTKGQREMIIDVRDFPDGAYIGRLVTNTGVRPFRFAVVHQ